MFRMLLWVWGGGSFKVFVTSKWVWQRSSVGWTLDSSGNGGNGDTLFVLRIRLLTSSEH